MAGIDSNSPLSGGDTPQSALLGEREEASIASKVNLREKFPEIIGRSPALLKTLEQAMKVANSCSPVLILGESGTGKELIASAIHRLSPRNHKEIVAINCSAIPEDLLEAELFGHERGAFTGAGERRIGKFVHASGGTIFMDEIGDMSPQLQAKLLRVLQEMSVTPLGSNTPKKIDVRVIAATNIDLEVAIAEGRFRHDLFYRLNVLPIFVPPLRHRDKDSVQIVEHFLEVANRQQRMRHASWFSPDALRAMENYDWPGNIRQLQNIVERLVVIKGGGCIELQDLPDKIANCANGAPRNSEDASPEAGITSLNGYPQPSAPKINAPNRGQNTPESRDRQAIKYPDGFGRLPDEGMNLTSFVENLENGLIIQALERTRNNKQQAAKLLGLNRTTLVERIKKRKIQGPHT